MNFARGRHLDWFGPASLIGCPGVLIAYLVLYHAVPWLVASKAVAALYFLCFVPGYLVQRFFFRLRGLSKFETMLSSLLLGVFLTPMMWYALCWLGISAVFFPMTIAVGLAVPLVTGWIRRIRRVGERVESLVAAADAPILWLSLAIAILWSYSVTMIQIRDGRIYVKPYIDHIFHATLIAELARGIPAQVVPFVAGAKKFAYHEMPDVWCDMMRRFTGATLESAYFYIALTFRYVFVSLGCYLALVRRFGRLAALTGVGFLFAVVWPTAPPGRDIMFGFDWMLQYLNASYPTAFGLAGVFLVLYYVSIIEHENARVILLLTSVLSVLLLWFKANIALAVAPAVAVLSFIVLGKRGDYRWWWLCIGVQALLAGIRQWQLSAADFAQVLVSRPLAFLVWWWDALDASPGWPTTTLAVVRQIVESLPVALQWPLLMTVCLIHRFHVGLIAVPYLLMRAGKRKGEIGINGADILTSFILVCTLAGFAIFPVAEGLVWNVSFHLWALVAALLLPLVGVQLCGMLRRAICSTRVLGGATIVMLLIALICNTYRLRTMVWQTNGRRTNPIITKDLYACYRFIQAATPLDSMILHPIPSAAAAGMFTERRVVLESQQPWIINFFDTRPIRSDVKRFYVDPHGTNARVMLDRYHVDYVIADVSGSWESPDPPWLVRVFQRGDEAVFRVDRHVESSREISGIRLPAAFLEERRPSGCGPTGRAELLGVCPSNESPITSTFSR